MAASYAQVRRFALALPGVSEEPHFDVPSWRVNKRIFVTVWPGNALHVFVADAERDQCLNVYASCTEKVIWGGKVVGIRVFLDKATRGAVEDLILRAWKHRAAKKAVAAYAAVSAAPSRLAVAEKVKPAAKGKHKAQRKPLEKAKPATSVDAYIAGFPPPVRARLAKVRAAIRSAAPEAEEAISYRIPAYRLNGVLLYFAGFAGHIGVYPAPRSHPEFRDELAGYAGGKGTVQFPHDRPLPLDLLRRIVKFRIAENRARKGQGRSTRR